MSGEGPIFPTDSKFGDMLVVVVPSLGPRIIGAKTRYRVRTIQPRAQDYWGQDQVQSQNNPASGPGLLGPRPGR